MPNTLIVGKPCTPYLAPRALCWSASTAPSLTMPYQTRLNWPMDPYIIFDPTLRARDAFLYSGTSARQCPHLQQREYWNHQQYHIMCMMISIKFLKNKMLTMEHRIRRSTQSDCQWPASGSCQGSSHTLHRCGRREPGSCWEGSNQPHTTQATLQGRKVMHKLFTIISTEIKWDGQVGMRPR